MTPRRPRLLPFLLLLTATPAIGAAAPRVPSPGVSPGDRSLLASDETPAPAAADCARGDRRFEPDAARLAAIRTVNRLAASHPCSPGLQPSALSAGCELPWTPPPTVNFVDEEIFGALAARGIRPAPLSTDAEFLRRVTLDLTGQIPDAATVAAFLADADPAKRDHAIERLLGSAEFVDRWAFFYGELFRVVALADTGRLGFPARNTWHADLRASVAAGTGWDDLAASHIAGFGNNHEQGEPNYTIRNLQNNGPPQDSYDNLAAATGSLFLGTNLFCISCHNGRGHTSQVDLWLTSKNRTDFWGLAAFYARTGLNRTRLDDNDIEFEVFERPRGEYELDTTDGNKTPRAGWEEGLTRVTPSFPLTGERPASGESYRAALARMVVAHPQFARAMANRLWKEMFGLGIVEPLDGFDLLRQDPAAPPPEPWTVQPSHPALLERLAVEYRATGYDLRGFLRLLARSSAYQLSGFYPGEWDEAWTPLVARHLPRRLRAEELRDALARASAVPAPLQVRESAPVDWAGQLPDPLEPRRGTNAVERTFLDTFGRGNRDSVLRSSEGSILQGLALLNDPTVTERLRPNRVGSTVAIAAALPDDDAVRLLFLAFLARLPSEWEATQAREAIVLRREGVSRAQAVSDVAWALCNKLDFVFCH